MPDTDDLKERATSLRLTDVEARLTALESAVSLRSPRALVTTSAPSAPTPAPAPPHSPPSLKPYPARLKITNNPPTQQRSLLLNLTAELRYEIFRLVVISSNGYLYVDKSGYSRPALLNTCKEIYLEASSIFYASHAFKLKTLDYDSTICTRWTRETMHMRPDIRVCTSNTGSPNWQNLVSWVKKQHSGELKLVVYSESVTSQQKQRLQEAVVMSFHQMTFTMREYPWKVLEEILNDARQVLSAIDGRWDQD